MELKETIDGMLSENVNERFKAEYQQLNIRITRLKKYIAHYKPKIKLIDLYILEEQLKAMIEYRNALELRASLEEISLE